MLPLIGQTSCRQRSSKCAAAACNPPIITAVTQNHAMVKNHGIHSDRDFLTVPLMCHDRQVMKSHTSATAHLRPYLGTDSRTNGVAFSFQSSMMHVF